MTQVEDRHVADPALAVEPDLVVVTSAPAASPPTPAQEAAAPQEDTWPALVLATPRPLFTAVAVVGGLAVAVATSRAVVDPVALPVGTAAVAWTLWLAVVAATSRRRLRVAPAGLAYHDGIRQRDIAWSDLERVEVTTGPRVVRRPRLILSAGRSLPLPPTATWATDGVVSPVDRIAALAGEAGVPVTCVPSRRGVWIGTAVVVLGVLAGVALGVAVAAMIV